MAILIFIGGNGLTQLGIKLLNLWIKKTSENQMFFILVWFLFKTI